MLLCILQSDENREGANKFLRTINCASHIWHELCSTRAADRWAVSITFSKERVKPDMSKFKFQFSCVYFILVFNKDFNFMFITCLFVYLCLFSGLSLQLKTCFRTAKTTFTDTVLYPHFIYMINIIYTLGWLPVHVNLVENKCVWWSYSIFSSSRTNLLPQNNTRA